MLLFQKLAPTFIKEDSSARLQIDKLKEILPKASPPVQEIISQDVNLLEMGLYGENKIIFELKNSHIPMYVLHDLFLSYNGLTAQIDFLVICQRRTYILESKNLFGNIEINSNGDFIRTVQFGKQYKKEGIYSPITQNIRHLELMRDIALDSKFKNIKNIIVGDAFSSVYVPVVVLANDKSVLNVRYAKKEVKQQVIRADQLISYIRNTENQNKPSKRSFSEMKESADFWLSKCSENLTDYIQKYRDLEKEYRTSVTIDKTEPTELGEDIPFCPNCRLPMVKREVKSGERKGRFIWGCQNYPRCRNIVNID